MYPINILTIKIRIFLQYGLIILIPFLRPKPNYKNASVITGISGINCIKFYKIIIEIKLNQSVKY